MKQIVVSAVIAVLASAANADTIVDVTKVAGKTENKVLAYLGKPTSCGKSKYGKKVSTLKAKQKWFL